ncbi:MAG: hypothetical protein ACRD3E_15650 [Terriglobales bacterium]
MATNPRFPEPTGRDRDDDRLNADLRRNAPKSGFPWVVLALVVAAAILTAIIIWMPRTPRSANIPASSASVPPQPTGGQIQFSGAKLVPSPVGNEVAMDALMSNTGNTAVTGVAVTGQFAGQNGQAAATIPSKVMILDPASGNTIDLVQAPIEPNTQKPVRIVFQNVPQAWNHTVPALTITTVTAEGTNTGGIGSQPTGGRERSGQQSGNTATGEAHRNKPAKNQGQQKP